MFFPAFSQQSLGISTRNFTDIYSCYVHITVLLAYNKLSEILSYQHYSDIT